MPGFTTAQKNTWLDGLGIDAISLHSADPGQNGANEIAGGAPAYARKVPAWNAAANGQKTLNGALTFDVPAGATVAHVGFWAGATFKGSSDVTDEAYTGQGTFTVNSATLAI